MKIGHISELISFIQFVFIVSQAKGYQNMLKQSCRLLASTHTKLSLKTEIDLELDSLPNFMHDFLIKIFLLSYYINWLNFIVWLLLLRETLGNMCTLIVCHPGCHVKSFQSNLLFLIKPSFWYDDKVKKGLLRHNKKVFSSFVKGFHCSK